MVKNLKVTIIKFSYFLPCQVVEQAGFKVLLGCPFTVVTEAVTKDFWNGDQHIMLYEPVSGCPYLFLYSPPIPTCGFLSINDLGTT